MRYVRTANANLTSGYAHVNTPGGEGRMGRRGGGSLRRGNLVILVLFVVCQA